MSLCLHLCVYVCLSVMGLRSKYTCLLLYYVHHCFVRTLCGKGDDKLGGPFTKTVNLLYDKNMCDDRRLVRYVAAE